MASKPENDNPANSRPSGSPAASAPGASEPARPEGPSGVESEPAGPWVAGTTGLARLVCLIGGPLTILAGGVGVYAAASEGLGAQAFVEVVIVLAGVVALLMGLRVLRGGVGISLASLSGTVLVAAILTDPSVRFALTSGSTVPDRAGIDMVLLFIARGALGVLFGAAAAITVLERHPKRSLALLAKAVVALVPFAAIAGIWVVPGIRGALTGVHPIVTGFASTLSLIIACGLFSMAVHWTVQAFEAGRTLGRQPLGS